MQSPINDKKMETKENIGLKGVSLKTYTLIEGNKTPLVIEPAKPEQANVDFLNEWILSNKEDLDKKMTEHGAVLFRNFNTKEALDFEKIALAIDAHLQNNYLGTSPRNGNTTYTFSASELPAHYPIMQHCEMSFLKSAPRRIFFYCHIEPQIGGETPICDFRKVYSQLKPEVREAFETKGIKNIRNYFGPQSKKTGFSVSLKRWDDMFKTTERTEVERQCREQELQPVWNDNDRLTLINDQDAVKIHPVTGEKVWFNHAQVFHNASAAIEYGKIAKRQKTFNRKMLSWVLQAMTWRKRTFTKTFDHEMHVTYRDGSEIPVAYIKNLQDVIWDNLIFLKWKQGDIIALDNFSTSHGRMPFEGPRNIMVAWTD